MIRLSLASVPRPGRCAGAAALAAFAILLAATGPHLASLYAASGISGCQARQLRAPGQQLPPGSFTLLAPTGRYTCSASCSSSSPPPLPACSGVR